ncbi:MAG: hypothetical protein NT023_20700 [Armatimonadetes bacterium]|nr:hypothetical protein [Armatimonadota bacterium]
MQYERESLGDGRKTFIPVIRHIILDSSPLSLLSNPNANPEVIAINQWSRDCVAGGHIFYIPEIIDYEVRRELLRADKTAGIRKLGALKASFKYVEITTAAMVCAAELWAMSRRQGLPTAHPKAIDVDVILAAQALTLGVPADDLIVATTNLDHLSQFVPADLWTNIRP